MKGEITEVSSDIFRELANITTWFEALENAPINQCDVSHKNHYFETDVCVWLPGLPSPARGQVEVTKIEHIADSGGELPIIEFINMKWDPGVSACLISLCEW